MHKLLLTLVAFSSGVLCNVAQNLTADSVLPTSITILLDGRKEFYNRVNPCCTGYVQRNDYVVTPGVGAHKLHTRKVKWSMARLSCTEEGGELAIINSNAEGDLLLNLMKRENLEVTWLGVHDQFEEGDWVTLNGDSLNVAGYNKWLPGEPNNQHGNENCGSLVNKNGMNDLPCNFELPYICKINLNCIRH